MEDRDLPSAASLLPDPPRTAPWVSSAPYTLIASPAANPQALPASSGSGSGQTSGPGYGPSPQSTSASGSGVGFAATPSSSSGSGSGLNEISGMAASFAESPTSQQAQVASFTDNDANTDPSKYQAQISWGNGQTSAGVISYVNGQFVVTGSTVYDEEGTYPVQVTITDTDGDTLVINGTAQVYDAPLSQAAGQTIQVAPGQVFNGVVATFVDSNAGATPADFASPTILWGDGTSSAGTVVQTSGSGSGAYFQVQGSHAYSSSGSFGVTINIQDDGGSQATAYGSAFVASGLPVAVNDAYSVLPSGPTSVSADNGVLANDSDDDGDSLTAQLVSGPSHGTLQFNSDGSFTYTPGSGFAGTDSFTYQASDGTNLSNIATVTLTTAPVASDQAYAVNHDTPLSVDAADGLLSGANDADGDSLTAALATPPGNGTVTVNSDGSFTYTPNAGYVGNDSFTFTASDGTQTSAPATVSIAVTNDVPQATNGLYSTPQSTALSVNAANGVLADASDDDGDSLTAQLVSGPSNGTLQFNPDGSFTYTPNPGFFGSDSFQYAAGDGVSTSSPATVTLAVDQVLADGNNPAAVASGDFTGSGNLGFAVANSSSNTVSVYLGNGAGGFTQQPDVAVGRNPVALAAGDFNGDGKADLAVVNQADSTVSILLSNGTGGFTTAQVLQVQGTPTAIAVGDLTGNGRQDLAVTSAGSNTVSIFLNNGDGTFTAGPVLSVGSNPSSVAIGDLNGDGKADLAVANNGSNNVSVLLGNGDGTFQTPVSYAVGNGPTAVAIGDFNADGQPDLAVANGADGTVSILSNQGSGVFASSAVYAVGSNPVALAVGNFAGGPSGGDGDADDQEVDLAVVNQGSGTLSILSSQGSTGLLNAATLTTISGLRGIAMAPFIQGLQGPAGAAEEQGVVVGNGGVALAMAGPAAAPAARRASTAVAATADGTYAVVGYQNGDIRDSSASGALLVPNEGNPIQRLALSPDTNKLAVLATRGANQITVWDISGRSSRLAGGFTLTSPVGNFANLAFSGDNTLVTTDTFGNVNLWDLTKPRNKPTTLARLKSSPVLAVSDTVIVAGTNPLRAGERTTLTMWSVANLGAKPATVGWRDGRSIYSLALSPDSKQLLAGFNNGTALLYDISNLQKFSDPIGELVASKRAVNVAVSFVTDPKSKKVYQLTGDATGNISSFDIVNNKNALKVYPADRDGRPITQLAPATGYGKNGLVLAASDTKVIQPIDLYDLLPRP